MKHRYFDLGKLTYSHQFLLPAILAALPIPEDYEHIKEIEHLLKPIPEDPDKQKSLEDIQREFEKKIDKLTETWIAQHRYCQEMCNSEFRKLGKKQERAFENLRIYGTTCTPGIWGGIAFTGSTVLNSTTECSNVFQIGPGPSGGTLESVSLKPRNWITKQIINLLFDMKSS